MRVCVSKNSCEYQIFDFMRVLSQICDFMRVSSLKICEYWFLFGSCDFQTFWSYASIKILKSMRVLFLNPASITQFCHLRVLNFLISASFGFFLNPASLVNHTWSCEFWTKSSSLRVWYYIWYLRVSNQSLVPASFVSLLGKVAKISFWANYTLSFIE